MKRNRKDPMKNSLLPSLDVVFRYAVDGLGGTAHDALSEVSRNNFHEYRVEVQFSYPIGNREAEAGLRMRKLQQSQAVAQVKYRIDCRGWPRCTASCIQALEFVDIRHPPVVKLDTFVVLRLEFTGRPCSVVTEDELVTVVQRGLPRHLSLAVCRFLCPHERRSRVIDGAVTLVCKTILYDAAGLVEAVLPRPVLVVAAYDISRSVIARGLTGRQEGTGFYRAARIARVTMKGHRLRAIPKEIGKEIDRVGNVNSTVAIDVPVAARRILAKSVLAVGSDRQHAAGHEQQC